MNRENQIKQLFLSSIAELPSILAGNGPILFLGSRTSTVIPYDRFGEVIDSSIVLVDSSKLVPEMKLEHGKLKVSGAANWKEAKAFCQSHGRTLLTSPTEELAQILSGVATSCTGERCFGHGTLRDQIIELKYMDTSGDIHTLIAERPLAEHALFSDALASGKLKHYQKTYESFRDYKNAPFPRMDRETDLMVGTEGQLGIVTEVTLRTEVAEPIVFLFFSLPKWEEDYRIHLDIYRMVQGHRDSILSCEMIDENSWSFLDREDVPTPGRDTIFLEVKESQLEYIYEELITGLEGIDENDIFSMPASKCHELRMKIPRAIYEYNSQRGVIKKGTDVQAMGEGFIQLLDLYRNFAQKGIKYNLFGHFGDAHLHFNFMPQKDQSEECTQLLEDFYRDTLQFKSSPFAEHGIGLLKQKFIRPFLSPIHYEIFSYLKSKMDPNKILFPGGYMGLKPQEIVQENK